MNQIQEDATAVASLRELIATTIRQATCEVFATMVGLEVEGQPEYMGGAGFGATDGLLAFVGLAGSHIGTGTVSCSAGLACRVSSQFLMTELEAVDSEVLDAVGEITNMILGNVKSNLENDLGQLCLSVPTVVYGKNFEARALQNGACVVVPFVCGEERFEVSLGLRPQPTRPGSFPLEERLVLESSRGQALRTAGQRQ